MEFLVTVPLLIIDDLGMRKLPLTAAEELLQIIMRRYERASTLLTSNRPVDDWGKLLGDVPTAGAILDPSAEDIAGARTVVANLWESNDDFSRGLMREFYTRLAAGMDKGRALQQAKLEMIRKYGQNASSPRLWAGFIMVGESRRSLQSD